MFSFKKRSIGIIGQGFVGGTYYDLLSQSKKFNIMGYDIDESRSKNTFEEVRACDNILICLPTPMYIGSGKCCTKIVKDEIAAIRKRRADNLIIVKSTVPPGTTEAWNRKYGYIDFSPEFLTEKNAYEDLKNATHHIIGENGKCSYFRCLKDLAKQNKIAKFQLHSVGRTMAEMVKYTRNTYLATRLIFFNEIAEIAEKLNVNYGRLSYLIGLDPRIGDYYNIVGSDDEKGFGGHCLPKDLEALIYRAKQLGCYPSLLEAVKEKNLKIRKNKDWLDKKMGGRSFTYQPFLGLNND